MKVYFVGYLTSHFIQDDLEILKENHEVIVFDLSANASSFKKIHTYLSSTLWEWKKVYTSDAVWIWFADYPALPIIAWAKLFRKPIVMRVAGWEVYAAPFINYGNQLNPIRGWVSRWIIKHSTVCVTPSMAYEKIIKSLVPEANVIVCPNSVDVAMCDIE
jgi:glycosyltransferase involved in cell wall biosynthesis